MRLAALSLTVALAFGPSLKAQNQTLVVPGDILIVKVLSKWGAIKKIVAVTPDGKVKPPRLRGMMESENVSVEGLGLDDATQKLQESYLVKLGISVVGTKQPTTGISVHVVIERGTVDQLLSE